MSGYRPTHMTGYTKAVKLRPLVSGAHGGYGEFRVTWTREEWEQRFGGPNKRARGRRFSGSGSGLTLMQEAAIRAALELADQGKPIVRRQNGEWLVDGLMKANEQRPPYSAIAALMPPTASGRPMSKGGAIQHLKAACARLGTTPDGLPAFFQKAGEGRLRVIGTEQMDDVMGDMHL